MSGRIPITKIDPDYIHSIYLNTLDNLSKEAIEKENIQGLSITNDTNYLTLDITGNRTFGILIISEDNLEITFNSYSADNLYCIVSQNYDIVTSCRLFACGEYGIIYVFFTTKELAEKYIDGVEDFRAIKCSVKRLV